MNASQRLSLLLIAGVAASVHVGCSLVTVQQKPFDPLVVTAEAPPEPEKPPSRVVLTASSIQIKEKVQFELGSAVILAASHGLLNEVAGVLKDNPQIASVQVEGHTDSTGGKSTNKKLSKKRASSVVEYLVSQGVEKARLIAKGFGPDRPIADNETDEGREKNRRVEFNIIKQGPKETVED